MAKQRLAFVCFLLAIVAITGATLWHMMNRGGAGAPVAEPFMPGVPQFVWTLALGFAFLIPISVIARRRRRKP